MLTVTDNGVGARTHNGPARADAPADGAHAALAEAGRKENAATANSGGSSPGYSSGRIGTSLVQSLASDLGARTETRIGERGTEVEVRWKAAAR